MAEITSRRPSSAGVLNGSSRVEAEWRALLGSMLEDVSHIVELELKLLEARLGRSMMAMTDRAIAGLILLYAAMICSSCLLAALILLLHEGIAWWQCFAIAGVVTMVGGLSVYAIMRGSPPPTENNKS
jgi:putative superfamily III holin-X